MAAPKETGVPGWVRTLTGILLAAVIVGLAIWRSPRAPERPRRDRVPVPAEEPSDDSISPFELDGPRRLGPRMRSAREAMGMDEQQPEDEGPDHEQVVANEGAA